MLKIIEAYGVKTVPHRQIKVFPLIFSSFPGARFGPRPILIHFSVALLKLQDCRTSNRLEHEASDSSIVK